jgi:hypothetical protein
MSKLTISAKAAADLSGKIYHFVRLSAANTVNQASYAADNTLVGVLLNDPKTGEAATVQIAGIGHITAGAAITAGDPITTNGSGRAVAASSGQWVMGKALESAAADGDVIAAIFNVPFFWK